MNTAAQQSVVKLTPAYEAEPAPTAAPTRFPALDALRAFSMLFIVYWHALMAYQDEVPWFPQSDTASSAFGFAAWFATGFTLRVFFVMAGFFSQQVYAQYGLRRFAQHRALRLVFPLAVMLLLFNFVLSSIRVVAGMVEPEVGAIMSAFVGRFSLGWLWFVYYLVLITSAAVLMSSAVGVRTPSSVSESGRHMFRSLVRSRWGLLALGLVSAATLFWLNGKQYPPFPTVAGTPGTESYLLRDPSLVNAPFFLSFDLAFFCYYATFFVFGWFLRKNTDLLTIFKRRWRWNLLIGLGLRVVTVPLVDVYEGEAWLALAIDLVTGVYGWMLVCALIGLFLDVVQTERAVLRYVADSSYAVYLVHLAPLLPLQALLFAARVPDWLAYAVSITLTTAIAFLFYEYCVRYTRIGAILNGQRRKPASGRRRAWALS